MILEHILVFTNLKHKKSSPLSSLFTIRRCKYKSWSIQRSPDKNSTIREPLYKKVYSFTYKHKHFNFNKIWKRCIANENTATINWITEWKPDVFMFSGVVETEMAVVFLVIIKRIYVLRQYICITKKLKILVLYCYKSRSYLL